MIFTEERTSTIEFRSRFKHIDYFKNKKNFPKIIHENYSENF